MKETQVVTITFFRFSKLSTKWFAFKQMGLAPSILKKVDGLQFSKMLGSGGFNGFSVFPNLTVYGLICVWENEKVAQIFFQTHDLFAQIKEKSTEYWTVFMNTVKSSGKWDGQNPFCVNSVFDEHKLLAVLTRATIKPKHLLYFWRFVPGVSQTLKNYTGHIFSIGIGELPLIQQATFSLWKNSKEMMTYAYQKDFHQNVVRKTRELEWYSEELFARFHPYASEGNWRGKNPLATYL